MKAALSILAGTIFVAGFATAQQPSYTSGVADETVEALIDCGKRSRPSRVGSITSEDGKVWTVPAATLFATAPRATDLHNECGQQKLGSVSALDLLSVPVIDAGGEEEYTAFIFADNYFELYINGVLIGVDPVPFTPFNSNVVRFKVDRPFSVAVKMVDWEETLGLGVESNRGTQYHAGDGGFVAQIQDSSGRTVAVTDEAWRAQTYYIAPIVDRSCLKVSGSLRDSAACMQQNVQSTAGTSAAHWTVPENWMMPDFDDTHWPAATVFTNDTVGVDNKKSYTNFRDVFDNKDADARFIWSTNLVLDNLVLLRTVVELNKDSVAK